MQPELAFEDKKAFDGGEYGLGCYRHILHSGTRFLKNSGFFVFEIGCEQAKDMKRLIEAELGCLEMEFFKDYSGYDRIVVVRYSRQRARISSKGNNIG